MITKKNKINLSIALLIILLVIAFSLLNIPSTLSMFIGLGLLVILIIYAILKL
jgi:hypothetical protein